MLHCINDFELIGDHAINMTKLARQMHDQKLQFSAHAKSELAVLTEALNEIMTLTLESFEKDDQQQAKHKNPVLGFFNVLANIYLTVIRGTPAMVQLLIMWFVIWASARSTTQNMVMCAVMTFGINSGAYVAEIIRSGIMSIDAGQMEAGRSLGLSYATTMKCVIIPQAFKNVLPALGNELITLLKETSIVTVIGLKDLTKGAMIIQGKTYQAIVPFLAIVAIYLAMVMILTTVFGRLERRMRKNDQR